MHTGLRFGYYDTVSGTWFGESHNYLSSVDRIELDIDDTTGKMKVVKVELVPIWADKQDPAVLALLKPIQEKVSVEMDKPIGYAADDLVRFDSKFDSSLGNWCADVVREAGSAELGFQNTHGIRSDIGAGTVTYRAVYQAFPFENTLVTMELTGRQLERLMRDNLRHISSGMQLSGMTVVYSTDERGDVSEMVIDVNGAPLKPDGVYRIATNNYLAYGGTGGLVFKEGRNITDVGISIRDYMIERFKSHSPVHAPASGRIKRVD